MDNIYCLLSNSFNKTNIKKKELMLNLIKKQGNMNIILWIDNIIDLIKYCNRKSNNIKFICIYNFTDLDKDIVKILRIVNDIVDKDIGIFVARYNSFIDKNSSYEVIFQYQINALFETREEE